MTSLPLDPDKALSQLDDESQYRYLLLDSWYAEDLFCKHYLDLELAPFQIFSMKLIRGRFHSEEEIYKFISEYEMEWMFDNGWLKHGGTNGVSPYYWKRPNVLILWPAAHGKALATDTPIATSSGWTDIVDLSIGDEVFDDAGNITRVTYVSPIHRNRKVYAVSSNNGEPIIADADHLWSVQLDRRKPFKVHTTEYLFNRTCTRRALVSVAGPMNLPPADLPLDPYVLGVWLGDGASNGTRIYQGEDDIGWMREKIESRGFKTVTQKDSIAFGVTGLAAYLRKIGVFGNKHIPSEYLRSSVSQRMDLLNGLVDTDGSVDTKSGLTEFTSVKRNLAEQVLELVRSLGVKASLYSGRATINGCDYGEKYRVCFYMESSASMPRKKAKAKDASRLRDHYISVEEAGRADTVCIQVDSPSHLFLAGKAMVPTHNTTIVTTRAVPIMEVCDNPNSRNQLIGKSETEAFSFSASIRRELDNPRLVKDFGVFQPSDKAVPWANQAFSVAQRQWRDVRENFEFFGTNSHAELGRRSDRVYLDDIETPDTARTPDMRDKLLEWVRIGPMTSPRPLWNRNKNGDVLVPKSIKWSHTARYWGTSGVGTIFHPEGLYAMFMRDPTFTCVKFDCWRDKKLTVPLDDRFLDADDLNRELKSIGILAFNKRYRNIAYNEEEMAFREVWVRGGEEEVNGQRIRHVGCLDNTRKFRDPESHWELYAGFDPASGSRSRWSAYSAFVILGVDPEDERRRIHLVDYAKTQEGFDRMLDRLLGGNPQYGIEGFYEKYRFRKCTVEKNAFGKWLVNNDRIKPYVDARIIDEHTTGGENKNDPEAGVFAMGAMIQDGLFLIPYQDSSDQELAEEFIKDLLLYPKGTNDLVMAMWLATQGIKRSNTKYTSKAGPGSKVRWVKNPAYQ